MEALSEYYVLALLVLIFSVPVVLNLVSRFRDKSPESSEEVGE